MDYHVIIVGGSYAGISAGLQLARARRRVLVIDAAERRNRFAATSHGFLGRDGQPPARIAAEAREQLLAYPTVEWLVDTATEAGQDAEGFWLATRSGQRHRAQRLILATGVIDELPAIDGLAGRWGKSVFHCPYCHGYELAGGPVGVLATSELALHQALMLPDWGPTTLFLDAAFAPDAEQRASLERRGIRLEYERVRQVVGDKAEVVLADGRVIALEGLFVQPRTRMASPLAEALGCEFEQGPLGAFIKTDATRETSVRGVFACGDAATAFSSVAIAVGDGAKTGAGTHRSLVFGLAPA
ncbi:NAD(P)/FAD-dependent oxidoreductase [Pseudomonas chlororaphis]|uniref:NAD(P)/FAD-dependent oxidoreductase n=1 Tax=Pseudomonas chlororaphis TaxID=587753 RepID=UPI001E299B5A|nr:NAD(P)/FAD-dependent oxidoreductase [Pseudomonas chlororaphis]MCB2251558.1 NAD(P)/FAD-dependent oxidoreductase [Pseudomonas chlororaphis]